MIHEQSVLRALGSERTNGHTSLGQCFPGIQLHVLPFCPVPLLKQALSPWVLPPCPPSSHIHPGVPVTVSLCGAGQHLPIFSLLLL